MWINFLQWVERVRPLRGSMRDFARSRNLRCYRRDVRVACGGRGVGLVRVATHVRQGGACVVQASEVCRGGRNLISMYGVVERVLMKVMCNLRGRGSMDYRTVSIELTNISYLRFSGCFRVRRERNRTSISVTSDSHNRIYYAYLFVCCACRHVGTPTVPLMLRRCQSSRHWKLCLPRCAHCGWGRS